MPGCYPTAVSLALAPGLAAGVLEPEDIVVVAASGTSGAGKSLKPHLLGAEVMGSMSPYGVGGVHRHTPEIEQNLSAAAGAEVTVSFTPTLAPMSRGILATCTAKLAEGVDPATVRAAWETAYADEPFVHLLPPGSWPRTADVVGSNSVHLQLAVDERAGRVVVTSAIDNLTKGTAGGAIQCANLALGLPETTGLTCRRSRTVSTRRTAAVTTCRGASGAAGVTAGLKASGRPDLALVVNDGPDHSRRGRLHEQPGRGRSRDMVQAGRHRRSRRRGRAQLRWRQRVHRLADGFLDTHRTAEQVAGGLGISAGDVAVCSTGLIGERLPMDLLLPGVDVAVAALCAEAGRTRPPSRS